MITFKVDGKEIQVGGDVRVEADLGDGKSIIVILTHEGIITDCYDESLVEQGKLASTSSITYDERFISLVD